jgi:hypothetical protein
MGVLVQRGIIGMWKKNMTANEASQTIERFLENRSLYPQEWNDFVDTPQLDKVVENFRLECYKLDPLVNRPEGPEPQAIASLELILKQLRSVRTDDIPEQPGPPFLGF